MANNDYSDGEGSGKEEYDEDTLTLAQLGYRQVFSRKMSTFQNFAISFSIISILSGPLNAYFIPFTSGGPAVVTIGWLLSSIFITIVSFSLAEIASSMPASGAIYFWSAKLGGPGWGWVTGWMNMIGVIAVTAAIDMGAAIFYASLVDLWLGINLSNGATFLIFTALLATHLFLNMQKVSLLGLLNSISAWWHLAGFVLIVAVLVFVPDHHQSASFVFASFNNDTGFGGGTSFSNIGFWYVCALGLLMVQYTVTAFGASAHLAEETTAAARAAAIGMTSSVYVSLICGFILMVAVTFAVPDVAGVVNAGGDAIEYIFAEALGSRWAIALLLVASVAQFFCGNAALASASRMVFAFSRDGALPGGRNIWRKVSKKNQVPVNALLLCTVGIWAIMIPTLVNGDIGYAVGTSIAVIGLNVSFSIPIYLRWRMRDKFQVGPWSIGKNYRWMNPVSFCWIWFFSLLFMAPTSIESVWFGSKFTWTSANYAPLTFFGLLFAVGIWWLVSARKWYTGPIREVDEKLVLMDRGELDQLPDSEMDKGEIDQLPGN